MKFFLSITTTFLVTSWGMGVAFADSTGSTVQGKAFSTEVSQKEETGDEGSGGSGVTEARKEKIKEEITSYIIDSYKAQGDKIIKDIDQTLQKTIPDKNARIEAYEKISTTLEARRTYNQRSQKITETSKKIIDAFLTHMIDSLQKRENDLRS